MKKLFLVLALALITNCAYASVTNIKWGVDVYQNLRFVFELSETVGFDVNTEKDTLTVTVQTPYEGIERTEAIRSEFASEMYIQAAGTKTVLRVPFNKPVPKDSIRSFTLKQDPVTKRPCRIVVDILKKLPNKVQTNNVVTSDTVSNMPNMANRVKVGSMPSPVKAPPPVAAQNDTVVVESKPVALNKSTQIAKIPEIKHNQPETTQSETPVVGSQPVRITGQQTQSRVTVGQSAKVGTTPSFATQEVKQEVEKAATPNVVIGSTPTNKTDAESRLAQRGKEAVASILGKVSSSINVGKSSSSTQNKKDKIVEKVTQQVEPYVDKASHKIAEQAQKVVEEQKAKLESKYSTKVPDIQIISGTDKSKKTETKTQTATDTKQTATNTKKNDNKGNYRTKGGIKGKIITIDPGHGGSDPGAVSNKGTYEKTITLSMAKKLKSDLEKLGAVVYLTRNTDADVSQPYADDEVELQARVDIAEKQTSDLFISLHINASVNRKASGISTYYYSKTNYDGKLAECIHKQLTSNFGLTDMGVREANFYVTKRCSMPAVLMELGFITNSKEEKTISGNWFQDKAMGLVAKGIADYFK